VLAGARRFQGGIKPMRSTVVARQSSTGVSPVLREGVLAVRFWGEFPSIIGFWFEPSFILIACTGETPVLRCYHGGYPGDILQHSTFEIHHS